MKNYESQMEQYKAKQEKLQQMTKEQLRAQEESKRNEMFELKVQLEKEVRGILETVATAEIGSIRVNPDKRWNGEYELNMDIQFAAEKFHSSFEVGYSVNDEGEHLTISHGTSGKYSAKDAEGMQVQRVLTIAAIWQNEKILCEMFKETCFVKMLEASEARCEAYYELDKRSREESKAEEAKEAQSFLESLKEGQTITITRIADGRIMQKYRIDKLMNKMVDVCSLTGRYSLKRYKKEELYKALIYGYSKKDYEVTVA